MRLIRTRKQLLEAISGSSVSVGLVPTMGYLHEGHLSLIRMAAAERRQVVVSVFVNPTQFNNPDDLENYPRDEERDMALAKAAGCDVFFAPSLSTMYPEGTEGCRIVVPGVGARWEGEHRPGHFDGVATVVAKLFNIVMPEIAFFGEKDWQQCRVVAKMAEDLDFPVELRFGPTIREADGLAMASRNARLEPISRVRAAALHQVLRETAATFRGGAPPRTLEAAAKENLLISGFQSVDYVGIVDEDTLEPLDSLAPGFRVLAAATIGGVRLIDNIGEK